MTLLPFNVGLVPDEHAVLQDVLVSALALARSAAKARLASNLSLSQALILGWIARFPGTTAGQLAEDLGLEPSGISAALKALTRAGLVEKIPDPRDGRQAMLRMTAKGRETQREAQKALDALLAKPTVTVRAVELEAARHALQVLSETFAPPLSPAHPSRRLR